jgi:hypothetical protein
MRLMPDSKTLSGWMFRPLHSLDDSTLSKYSRNETVYNEDLEMLGRQQSSER